MHGQKNALFGVEAVKFRWYRYPSFTLYHFKTKITFETFKYYIMPSQLYPLFIHIPRLLSPQDFCREIFIFCLSSKTEAEL